jgi:hypothetical protein
VSHHGHNCEPPPTDLKITPVVAHLATSSGLRNESGCCVADRNQYSVVGRMGRSGGQVPPKVHRYRIARATHVRVITGRQPLCRNRETVLFDAAVRPTSVSRELASGCREDSSANREKDQVER